MKKLYYSGLIFVIVCLMSSLTAEINQDATASNASMACTGKYARSSSCDGCHASSSQNGPIIIIFSGGKKGTEFVSINEGNNDVVIYNTDDQEQTTTFDFNRIFNNNSLNIQKQNTLSYGDKFYTAHGALSETIIANSTHLQVVSPIKQNINLHDLALNHLQVNAGSNQQLQFTVESLDNSPASIQVFNSTGKLVYASQIELTSGLNEKVFQLDNVLSTGIYICALSTNQDHINSKVLIR